MGELSSDFKTSFGRLLVLIKLMNLSVEGHLQYCATLLSFTKSGLIVLRKYDETDPGTNDGADEQTKQARENAQKIKEGYALLKATNEKTSMNGRYTWQLAVARQAAADIEAVILPVALSNGVLILNKEVTNVTDLFRSQDGIRERESDG